MQSQSAAAAIRGTDRGPGLGNPVGYYRANSAKSLEFVAYLLRNGRRRLIFSSSAAIYGASAYLTVDEDSAIGPQSPYARIKEVCETMSADIAASELRRVLSPRYYFDPIGADPRLASVTPRSGQRPRDDILSTAG